MRLHWAIPLLCLAEEDQSGLMQSGKLLNKFSTDCVSGRCHPKTTGPPPIVPVLPPVLPPVSPPVLPPKPPAKPVTTPAPLKVTTPMPKPPPVKPSTTAARAGCSTFQNMPKKFEPSGATYVNGVVYSVSDEGTLGAWKPDGTFIGMWRTGGSGDWEGLSATSLTSNYIYIAQEYPPKMLEWDVTVNKFTGKSWSFPGMKADSKHGLEGFTYVASNNVWLAGSQKDASVTEYTCDLSKSGACTKGKQWPSNGLGEISGLAYDSSDDTVYGVSDRDDMYVQFDKAGSKIRSGKVSIKHCEGIMPLGDGRFVLADDGGKLVACTLDAMKVNPLKVKPSTTAAPIEVGETMGLCTLKGDPHIKTFDRTKVDRHFYNYGDYWVVKRDDIWVQARYWSARPDLDGGNSAVRMLAISAPKVGGYKMVLKAKGLNGWEQIMVKGNEPQLAAANWTGVGIDGSRLTHEVNGSQHTFTYDDFAKIIVDQRSLLNVMIEMPVPAGAQSGHCGNFNGNAADDVLSKDMVTGPELLFDAREWTTVLPAGVQCTAEHKVRGQHFCTNLYEKAHDIDPEDIQACIVDYCGAGREVAEEGRKFDERWHAEMTKMIKEGRMIKKAA